MQNIYAATADVPVIDRDVSVRAQFITRTYAHLFGAIAAFTLLEVAFFKTGLAESIAGVMLEKWWLVFGGFIIVSWVATSTVHRARSLPMQYLALVGFVAAEAVVFAPLLWIAQGYESRVIESAAAVTLGGFVGLTAIAVWTRKDFSFLGAMLRWCVFGAILAIVAALIFGFHLGTWFSAGMVVLAGAAILYNTSNIIRHYPEDRYVAASLDLFASVAMMFWYVLRLFMSRD
jgi:FtsH-binding integral membrane protein